MNEISHLSNCCAVCLEEYSLFHITTKCKHKFHYNCFKRYIEKTSENKLNIYCPLCKTDLFKISDYTTTTYEEKLKMLQDAYTINIPDAINWEVDIDSYTDTFSKNTQIRRESIEENDETLESNDETAVIEYNLEYQRARRAHELYVETLIAQSRSTSRAATGPVRGRARREPTESNDETAVAEYQRARRELYQRQTLPAENREIRRERFNRRMNGGGYIPCILL